MAKKQTRRSISVSRTTYERLKAFCECNNISMSQLVETRVNDFLGPSDLPAGASTAMPVTVTPRPMPPRPVMPGGMPRALDTRPTSHPAAPGANAPHAPHAPQGASIGHGAPASQTSQSSGSSGATQGVPMTSAAARFAVEPPPPIIKPRQDTAAPKPAEKRPEQIFTF